MSEPNILKRKIKTLDNFEDEIERINFDSDLENEEFK
jgi:hypothetical protein